METLTKNGKRVIRFDASSMQESSCNKRWWLKLIEGYQPREGTNNDTQYGSAVHKFDAVMFQSGGNLALATKAALEVFARPCFIKPDKKHLTDKHLLKTCFALWEQYRKNDNFQLLSIEHATCFNCGGIGNIPTTLPGQNTIVCNWCNGIGTRSQPAVELSFTIPVYEDNQLIIEAAGTMDKLGRITNGANCIGDTKVTSSWDKQKFIRPFVLSPQFRFYDWAIRNLALRNPDSIFAEVAKYPIGIFIDAIFIGANKDAEFYRSEVQFLKQWERDEFDGIIANKIDQIKILSQLESKDLYRDGIASAQCHNGYGFCKYFNVCATPDEIAAGHILKRDFVKKFYDPLTFGE